MQSIFKTTKDTIEIKNKYELHLHYLIISSLKFRMQIYFFS